MYNIYKGLDRKRNLKKETKAKKTICFPNNGSSFHGDKIIYFKECKEIRDIKLIFHFENF